MQIPVLVERIANNGYRARTGEPLAYSVEAATRDEAVAKLGEQLQTHLSAGAELLTIDLAVSAGENPWVKYAGMFQNEPMFDEVLRIMEENCRRDEADPNYL